MDMLLKEQSVVTLPLQQSKVNLALKLPVSTNRWASAHQYSLSNGGNLPGKNMSQLLLILNLEISNKHKSILGSSSTDV
jgi:hypothetical protein